MPFKARQGAYVVYKGGYYPRPSPQGGKPQRSAGKIILVRASSRASEAGTRGPREAPIPPPPIKHKSFVTANRLMVWCCASVYKRLISECFISRSDIGLDAVQGEARCLRRIQRGILP